MTAGARGYRILFAGGGTGGHLYPALALGEAFERRDPRNRVHFVGAQRGVEARVLPERRVPHTLLPAEPIRRARPWENWRLLPAMTRSVRGLRRIFRDFDPDLVVGTGGYASGPVAAWALLNRVPLALQEQNSFPGFTTRLLARRARQVHLAFPEAEGHLKPGPRTEILYNGNPIRPPDRSLDSVAARARFDLRDGPVVLVVGGSQGSRAINEALLAELRGVATGRLQARPAELQLLWATGPAHFDSITARLAELEVSDWVRVVPYIQEMPAALASADLAISRAGAMALAELCAWGIPSILIPLPTAAANHQHHNAVALADAGAAVLVPEAELGSGRLWGELVRLAADPARRASLADNARGRGRPDAADEIVDDLYRLLEGSAR